VAAKERDQVRPNQELIALSDANIGAAPFIVKDKKAQSDKRQE
tara:strand:- start:24 stop:152 length:129 start_codon:yes stop_codon:yes gene_type:complete